MSISKEFIESLNQDPNGHKHFIQDDFTSRSIDMGNGNHSHIYKGRLVSLSPKIDGHTHLIDNLRSDIPIEPRKENNNVKQVNIKSQ